MIGRGFDSRRLQGTIPLPLMKTYIKLFAILSLLVTAPLFFRFRHLSLLRL